MHIELKYHNKNARIHILFLNIILTGTSMFVPTVFMFLNPRM